MAFSLKLFKWYSDVLEIQAKRGNQVTQGSISGCHVLRMTKVFLSTSRQNVERKRIKKNNYLQIRRTDCRSVSFVFCGTITFPSLNCQEYRRNVVISFWIGRHVNAMIIYQVNALCNSKGELRNCKG